MRDYRFFWTLLGKEVRDIVRDWRTLVMVTLTPLVFSGVTALITQAATRRTQDQSGIRIIADASLRTPPPGGVTFQPATTLEEARKRIAEDRADGALLVTDTAGLPKVEVVSGGGRLTSSVLRDLLFDLPTMQAAQRVHWEEVSVNDRFGGIDAYALVQAIGIISFVYMGIASVAADTVFGDKERGALSLLMDTKAPGAAVMLAKIVVIAVVGVFAALALLVGTTFTSSMVHGASTAARMAYVARLAIGACTFALAVSSILGPCLLRTRSMKEAQTLVATASVGMFLLMPLVAYLPNRVEPWVYSTPLLGAALLVGTGIKTAHPLLISLLALGANGLLTLFCAWLTGRTLEKIYRPYR